MSSDLAEHYRLVAIDIRGPGLSDKPRDGYSDSKLWADDVNAVIQALRLDHPILCGWSYGPLIILDYIRHYGEDAISGVNFVSGRYEAWQRPGAVRPDPEFLSLVPGFFATDAEESVRNLASLLRLCFAQAPSPEDQYLMLGYNVHVPPYVRQALFSRSFDNDDLLPKIRKPVRITHGVSDAIVKPAAAAEHKAGLTHAEIHMMANRGHAPFWEGAANFNRLLRTFSESL